VVSPALDRLPHAADYNNDGFLIFVAGANGRPRYAEQGNGTFTRDTRSAGALQSLRRPPFPGAAVDYDNMAGSISSSGEPAGAGKARRTFFFATTAAVFIDQSTVIPRTKNNWRVRDCCFRRRRDGDEDLWLIDGNGRRGCWKRSREQQPRRTWSQGAARRERKNNAGIGAKVELRAGTTYQTSRDRSVTHFGLGPHRADVLRVEWPNGVPQTITFPDRSDAVEREMLKGRVAPRTWDGKHPFVTDAMWRSALGMPLGLMGGNSAFAPTGASQEYLRISGDAFKPRDGRYVLQLTEELWETAYADEVKLVTVDHPDSVDVFVDERFVPPRPVKLRLYQVAERDYPLSAIDERGNDVLPALRKSDDVYVSNFTPTKYQGVVEPHDLVMDLGPTAGSPAAFLFLVDLSDRRQHQRRARTAVCDRPSPSPRCAMRAERVPRSPARLPIWQGQDDGDRSGGQATADHHVRIRTNMQIY
jgi:hypothetical protein